MSLFRASIALTLVVAVTALGAAPAGAASSSEPTVSAARSCHLSAREQRHLGASYVYRLRVRRTSCRTGKRVARAFGRCRHRHGRAGRCRSRVRGFRCRENRGARSPAQYSSSVRCRRGGKRVRFVYTQNI
jgi:hypothetical protein